MMLASVPPRIVPMFTVVSPSMASVGSVECFERRQQLEHRLDRRLAELRVRGVRCTASRANGDPQRAFRAARQLAFGRLAVDEKSARCAGDGWRHARRRILSLPRRRTGDRRAARRPSPACRRRRASPRRCLLRRKRRDRATGFRPAGARCTAARCRGASRA